MAPAYWASKHVSLLKSNKRNFSNDENFDLLTKKCITKLQNTDPLTKVYFIKTVQCRRVEALKDSPRMSVDYMWNSYIWRKETRNSYIWSKETRNSYIWKKETRNSYKKKCTKYVIDKISNLASFLCILFFRFIFLKQQNNVFTRPFKFLVLNLNLHRLVDSN